MEDKDKSKRLLNINFVLKGSFPAASLPQASAIFGENKMAKKSHTTKTSPWSISDRHNPQLWQEMFDRMVFAEHRGWYNILGVKAMMGCFN
jgi:hypothetical protein